MDCSTGLLGCARGHRLPTWTSACSARKETPGHELIAVEDSFVELV